MARALLSLSLLLLLALAAVPRRAEAQGQAAPSGWSVCNRSSYIVEVATGRPSGREVLVRGWTRMRPGECWTALPAPLARGVHYLYARTSTAHRGGRLFWGGPASLCVDSANAFSIENPPACEAMALETRQFREVRINKRDSWRSNLREAQNYSLSAAQSAGLQRLLLDAGMQTQGRVGQMDPRRVAGALARFRQEARLSSSSSYAQLVDALEAAARRNSDKVGLELCNRAAAKMWAAVARRRGEGWESRGWWAIAPDECARTIDEPLAQNVYFVHVVLASPQGDRYLAAGGEVFCTSPAKFVVIGREECAKRYYDESLFTAISPQGAQAMAVSFFDREFLPAGELPRQVAMPRSAAVAEKASPGAADRDRGRTGRTPPAPARTAAGGRSP